ncbi:MAG TPA: hypothetical protein VHN74_13165 [Candidatus Angelobacter sp.]|jgi:hypothetical protein|nr:hypothetical protein [Candidatus Angelobacter sp.]
MKSGTAFFAILLLLALAASATQQNTGARNSSDSSGSSHRLAAGMQSKLEYIQQNGSRSQPDQRPTVITEDEANDYLASGYVKLPQGVKKVKLQGASGAITAFLTVNFDELKAGQKSSNPLLGMFSGTHDVTVESDAKGVSREGTVNVKSVYLDGTEIPRMALEFFVEHYITPKYPNVGLDSQFQLPNRIDTATVGYHKLTVTQK